MKILSVKIKKRIEIVYAVQNKVGELDECVIKSGESPRPEFHDAMTALRDDAHTMMEFPESKKDRLYLTGMKFTHMNGSVGITLEGSVLFERTKVYNDFKSYEVFTGSPGKAVQPEQILPTGHPMIERITTMIDEAERYVNGERAQQDAFKNDGL